MHIPDGVLPPNVCILGYAVTGGVGWYALRKIKQDPNSQENIPKASLLTAAFFVTSLIHIPVPPSSIHFILNGLMGIVLGYYAFFAILIGLFFQAVMFQHGGLSTLGSNTVIMAIPALLAYHFFGLRNHYRVKNTLITSILAFFTGAGSLWLSACIFTVIIITNISPDLDAQAEKTALALALIGYGIQGILEGVFTAMLVAFLQKVKPELIP